MSIKKYDPQMIREKRETWTIPCIEAICEAGQETYRKRIQAVDMYADGYTLTEISRQTGISSGHIHELIGKCLTDDGNGGFFGYIALVPGRHLKKDKNDSESTRGLFMKLISRYPELKEFIKGNLEGDPKYTLEKDISEATLFKKFLVKCRDLGITPEEYPFSVKSNGQKSFRRYVKNMMKTDMKAVSNHIGKDEKKILASTGQGMKTGSAPYTPYACVQVDGHIIDVEYCTPVEREDGSMEYLECQRCWLFAVIDIATRCIIGYSMSQEFNYSQTDVLRAVRDSVYGHERTCGSMLDLPYPEGGGFPKEAFPDLAFPVFDMVMLDNAKSHLSKNVTEKLCDTLGCTAVYGATATPETRGIIERFFGTLERTYLHRIPSTTGSSASDVKRNSPGNAAKRYMITYDDLCEVMEAVIAEYNNTPNSAIMNSTPLSEMDRKLKNGFLPFTAGEELLEKIDRLLHMTKKVKVRGSVANGRRPYISFMNARYRNDILSSSFKFVGEELTIVIDPDDVSKVTGYLSNGTCIGLLTATGELGRVPHSLKSRERINRLASQKSAGSIIAASPITQFENELKKRASASRKARTQADMLKHEKKKGDRAVPEKHDSSATYKSKEQLLTGITHDDIRSLSSKEIWSRIRKGGIA